MKRCVSRTVIATFVSVLVTFETRVEFAQAALPTPIQITTTGGRRPTLYQDIEGCMMVVYESEAGLALQTVGTEHVQIIAPNPAFEPDWFSDGQQILYRGGDPYGLWVCTFQMEGGFDHDFFTDEGFDDGAVWGHNGRYVLAQTSSGPDGDGLVILAYANGFASYVNCLEPDQTSCSGEDPTISPDGLWIAFDDGALEKVFRSGGTSVYLTTFEQGGGDPSWSPDGNWIAFVRHELNEASSIWVTDYRGSDFGLAQLTDGNSGDWSPEWSPDSKEIYFTSDRSGTDEIWKVAFDAGVVPVNKLTWGKLKAHTW